MASLERITSLGLLANAHAPLIDGIVQLLRQQLFSCRVHYEEEEDDDDDDDDDDESACKWWNLLVSINGTAHALLRLQGTSLLPVFEEQLLPFMMAWLSTSTSPSTTAASLTFLSHLVESGGVAHANALIGPMRAALLDPDLGGTNDGPSDTDPTHDESHEAALYALGVVAQHAIGALPTAEIATIAERLGALLQAPSARATGRLAISRQAATALGKLLLHRVDGLDAPSHFALWFAWLPPERVAVLDEETRVSLLALCGLLSTPRGLSHVLGADGANLPQLLAVIAGVHGSSEAGEELSTALERLVRDWQTGNPPLWQVCQSAFPRIRQEQPGLHDKLKGLFPCLAD